MIVVSSLSPNLKVERAAFLSSRLAFLQFQLNQGRFLPFSFEGKFLDLLMQRDKRGANKCWGVSDVR